MIHVHREGKCIELHAAIRIVRGQRSEKHIERSKKWYENMAFSKSAFIFLSEVIDEEDSEQHNLKWLTECAHCKRGVPSVHLCYICGEGCCADCPRRARMTLSMPRAGVPHLPALVLGPLRIPRSGSPQLALFVLMAVRIPRSGAPHPPKAFAIAS